MSAIRVADVPLRPFFTPKTLAAYLAISERSVRSLVASGELPSIKLCGVRRIAAEDVDEWISKSRTGRR